MRNQTTWQTVRQAAREVRCSKQAVHYAIKREKIPTKLQWGVMLVPKPLPWKPNRERQARAK